MPQTNKISQPVPQPTKSLSSFGSLRRPSSFSRPQLIIFILAFGLIGYLLVKSFAAAPLVASLEAEQMKLPGGGSILFDSSASGGKAIKLAGNGTATGSVSFPSKVSALTVTAKGSQCQGSPWMRVSIDGVKIIGVYVSSSSWAGYSFNPPSAYNSGSHSLSISFVNDYKNRSCDRNLYVDITKFYGLVVTVPPPTVTISATPAAVMAGQASTLTWNSSNANNGCSASGGWSGSEPVSGSTSTGAINQTSSYTLTCTGSGGVASATATVLVTAATSFTTSLTQGTTITPPYTWNFNPGVPSVKGYFWADGVLLGTATPDSYGKYSFNIQSATLSAGAHVLGHAWDLADGTHQIGPTGYNVTIATSSGGGTSTTSFSAATNFPIPAFTPLRTVNVTSQSAFMSAWNNLQPGDLVNVSGVVFTGELTLANKQLSGYAEIHFDPATKFTGVSSAQNLPAVWINNDSNIRFYGGDISDSASGGQAGVGILVYDSTYVSWWNFVIHDVGASGLNVFSVNKANDHLDFKGQIYHWGLNLAWDPHAEKGTGLHGANLADSNFGLQNSRFALYNHDGATGAGIEAGGSASTDFFRNNQIYLWCQNLTMVALIQTGGNCFQFWGINDTGNTIKYLEAENLQGRPYETGGMNSGQSLSTNTVEYGRASNTNLNLKLNDPVPQSTKWDNQYGTVFIDVSPTP